MKKESVIQPAKINIKNLKFGSDSLKLEWDMIMKLRMKKESVIQQEIVEYLSSMADKYNFIFFRIDYVYDFCIITESKTLLVEIKSNKKDKKEIEFCNKTFELNIPGRTIYKISDLDRFLVLHGVLNHNEKRKRNTAGDC